MSVIVLRDKQEHTVTLTPDAKKRSEFVLPFPFERAADRVQLARLNLFNGL